MSDSKEAPVYDSAPSQDLNTQDTSDEKLQNLDNHKDFDDTSSGVSDSSNVIVKSFGIRKSELIMAQMTTWWQKALFCFTIFLGMYIISVENYSVGVLVGYATNSYKQHSLMSTIKIIQYVASAGAYPFFARASDIFGRLPLFVTALIFKVIGLIAQAKATDVQKYCAGTVFFGMGNAAQAVLWQLCIADATNLRWRVLAVAAMSFPTVINTWSIGNIVNLLVKNHSWSFGIALWAYTSTLVCLPFMLYYLFLLIKAWRTPAWRQISQEEHEAFIAANPTAKRYHDELRNSTTKKEKAKAFMKCVYIQTVDHLWSILWKVDLIGILLLVITLGLLLVPLTLAGGVHSKWKKAHTIVPLVLVVVSIPLFIIWESKFTPRPLLPYKLMRDRGVWAAFLIGLFTTFAYGMPNNFAYPVLYVGMNASITVATRTPALAGFTEGVSTPIFGLLVSRVRRTKAFIFFGTAMMFIAMGLYVHFRGSSDGIRAKYYRDGVAIGMCFLGVADACLLRMLATSLQSCTNHEYMGSVTAIFSTSYLVGTAVAASVSGAIWTQQMYGTIVRKMQELGVDPTMAMDAYASPYTFVMFNRWGSPQRRAVTMAYAEVQRKLSIVGLCLCVILLVCAFFLRDHRLPDAQNFGDDDLASVDTEKGEKIAIRDKTQIVYTDDKDYILDFLKRFVPGKKKSTAEN